MDARARVFNHRDPYDLTGTEGAFVAAMRENALFQQANCADYARILREQGFDPMSIRAMDDLARLPFLPTLYFKKHKLFAMDESKLLIRATSSGTGGTKSHIGFDNLGMYYGGRMVLTVAKYHGLFSPTPCNYLIFGYERTRENQTAISKTAYGATFFAPAAHRTYALRWKNGKYELDLAGMREALLRYSRSRLPVRFMGFPAYTYFFLQSLRDEGIRLQLPAGSRVMFGGGWKQFYTQKADKETVYRLVEEVLGIPESGCVEFFGAVEHPILYCDCKNHHFHVPVYSRVIIRDVDTLQPVPCGTPGLVNLFTPMTMSMPILSVMTDDIGVLHAPGSCGCGIQSPWLEILGRVGVRDIVTCAAGAEEFLKQ